MTTIDDEGGRAVDRPDDHPYADLPFTRAEDVLPVSRPGHRALPPPPRGTPSPVGRVVLPLVLAVVGVVGVFAAWGHLQSEQSDASVAAAVGSSAHATASASPVASTSPSASVAPTVSPSPAETASSTPTLSATPTLTPTKSTSVVVDRSIPVTVLNGTRRTGLASKVAASLRAKGWTVVSVGNWRSSGITTTTVFVSGHDDAAVTMRRDLPAADATHAPIGLMRDNRITVVVMDDYPRS